MDSEAVEERKMSAEARQAIAEDRRLAAEARAAAEVRDQLALALFDSHRCHTDSLTPRHLTGGAASEAARTGSGGGC